VKISLEMEGHPLRPNTQNYSSDFKFIRIKLLALEFPKLLFQSMLFAIIKEVLGKTNLSVGRSVG
jgi:hypothetical protein